MCTVYGGFKKEAKHIKMEKNADALHRLVCFGIENYKKDAAYCCLHIYTGSMILMPGSEKVRRVTALYTDN